MIALRIILNARQNDAKSPPVAAMRARSEQLKIDYPRLTVVSSVQESFVNLWSAAIRPCARVCVALECELGSSATDCVKNCIRHTYLRKCVGNLSRSDACYLQDSDPNISNHVLVFFLCSKNENVPQLCACEERRLHSLTTAAFSFNGSSYLFRVDRPESQ